MVALYSAKAAETGNAAEQRERRESGAAEDKIELRATDDGADIARSRIGKCRVILSLWPPGRPAIKRGGRGREGEKRNWFAFSPSFVLTPATPRRIPRDL